MVIDRIENEYGITSKFKQPLTQVKLINFDPKGGY